MITTNLKPSLRATWTLLAVLLLGLALLAGPAAAATVVDVSPREGAAGVSPDATVTVTFQEEMNPETVNGTTFTLTDPSGAQVPASVGYVSATGVATLTPDAPLAQGSSYSATVKGGDAGVRDVNGAGLDSDRTWSFTVDTVPPTIELTRPLEGQEVRNTVSVAATASDNAGLDRVEFLTNDAVRATRTPPGPFTAELDVSAFPHGSDITVAARAFDAGGRSATATRTVTVDREVSLAPGDTPPADGFADASPAPLSFTTDPDVVKRECRVIPNQFAPCSSPFSPTLTADGAYTYEVRVTDDAGNQKTETRSFTLDETAPTLTIDGGPGDGGVFGPNTTQTWNFTAGDVTSGPPEVRCSVIKTGTQEQHTFGPCSAASSHSVSNRDGGPHEFKVRATDGAGNQTTMTRSFTIDATAPTATLTGPAAGTKVGKTMTLTATAADDLAAPRVEFLVDGELKRTAGTAPYTATLDMAIYDHGTTHTVAARAVDSVGNVSLLSEAEITVDRQVSLTLGDTPVKGSRTNAASVPLSFTTDTDVPAAGRGCRVERSGVPPGPFAPCTSPYAPELTADGVHIYRVRVTDDAGNVATASRTFTFDKTPPKLTVNGPNDRVFGPGTRQEWTLSAGDATTGVDRLECSVVRAGTAPNYGACATATSHFAANKPEGSYELRVRATDGAGNATEVRRTFAIDATPPAVTIYAGLPDNAFTNKTSFTWAFSAEAGATFQCRVYGVGATPPNFGPCSGNGRHTAGSLAQGRYTFEVRGLDALGNRLDGPSASRAFTVDRTAPRISGVTPAGGARNVAPRANVTVTFTEKMRLLTLGRANFKLIRSGTSVPVGASVTFDPTTKRATLNPVNPLRRGATYRVVVKTGARDLANNPLSSSKSWRFKVK